MATVEYSVSGQKITTTATTDPLVKGTIGEYDVAFTFDSAWDTFDEKWAVFDPDNGDPWKQPIDSGACEFPGEVMWANSVIIGVYGVKDGVEYPTIWASRLWFKDGANVPADVSDYPEPSPVLAKLVSTDPQTFADEQKAQARENIDALGKIEGTEGHVVVIGSNQNISDSGISKDNLILAPQLASNNIKTDSVPYIYRQTGGGIGVGNREYDSIVGGSVVFQQKIQNGQFADSSGWGTRYGVLSVANNIATVIPETTGTLRGLVASQGGINKFRYRANHKVYISVEANPSQNINLSMSIGGTNGMSRPISANTWTRTGVIWSYASDIAEGRVAYYSSTSLSTSDSIQYKNAQVFDLTEILGSTVADRLYAMETASAGSGIAILKRMFPNSYYPYTATPSLESVSGLQKHQTKDADGNVIGEYPLDDSLTLRGVAVLDDDNNIKFDGDEYAPDGMVTRKYGIRAYQSGDESLANAITDMTNTVYKLTTPTTETAEPYESLQICDPLGTEEYVTTGICPVGHTTKYPTNQVAKLDGLPSDFSRIIAPTEKAYKATQPYTVGRLLIVNNILYRVISAISSGATLTVGTNISETTLDEVIASL